MTTPGRTGSPRNHPVPAIASGTPSERQLLHAPPASCTDWLVVSRKICTRPKHTSCSVPTKLPGVTAIAI